MTAAEFALAQRLPERVQLPGRPVRRRRRAPAPCGALDLRATLQHIAPQPAPLEPAFKQARPEMSALVVLLDSSDSMDRYARQLPGYVYGLTWRRRKDSILTFATRLKNRTRCLRNRDLEVALKQAGVQVHGWVGGTRIAASLVGFNGRWSRHVPGGNAAGLLVTEGLDRDGAGDLERAAAPLQRMAHDLVWLDPLLRFEGFESRASDAHALLPHVDDFPSAYNLASLKDPGRALRTPSRAGSTLAH